VHVDILSRDADLARGDMTLVRFRLGALLATQGISQSDLARRSGVSLVTINRIANNRTTRIDLGTVDALCATLGVEPGELLERDGKRKRGRS
jgi:DNA-binding Xre family transcriptional regulator